jgi:formate-dependent nitrite reductase membrane component NrfD
MSTSAARLPIVRDQFLIGYAPQGEWAWLIAAAFFLGKVGAGLFAISYFIDFELGALVGLLVVGVGKTTAHLLFLGRPERFLRAVVRWRSSRLSQGIITLGTFITCGAVYVAASGTVAEVFGVVAVATAIVLMFWEGFVMKASRGVPLWESWFLPVLAFLYSLLGGTTMTLLLQSASAEATKNQLEWIQLAVLVLNLVLIAVYLATSQVRSAAARFAAYLLTRGRLGVLFLAGAVGIGLVGTLVLASVAVATGSQAALAAAAATDLFGHFLIFFAILRAGVHPPIRELVPRDVEAAWSA